LTAQVLRDKPYSTRAIECSTIYSYISSQRVKYNSENTFKVHYLIPVLLTCYHVLVFFVGKSLYFFESRLNANKIVLIRLHWSEIAPLRINLVIL